MQKTILAFLLLFHLQVLHAQWTTSGTAIYNANTGNVGIGTTNPLQKLTIGGGLRIDDGGLFAGGVTGTNNNTLPWLHFGSSNSGEGIGSTRTTAANQYGLDFICSYTPRLSITNAGFVGIGTQTPTQKLTVAGGLRIDDAGLFNGGPSSSNALPWLSFGTSGSGEGIGSNRIGGSTQFGLEFYTGYTIRMAVMRNGNVLIGTTTQTNPAYMLEVAGAARAVKLVVNTTGADFVFDPGYHMLSLDEVGSYIHAHHHLPGIQPAAEMEKQGVSVGDNEARLLQKVEELTLYMIEMQKENKALKVRIGKLEKPNLRKAVPGRNMTRRAMTKDAGKNGE